MSMAAQRRHVQHNEFRKRLWKKSNSPLIDVLLSDILASVRGQVSLKIIFGLFIVFAYSFMIVSLLPIFLMLYPYLNLFWDNTRDMSFQEVWPVPNYIAFAFFKITLFRSTYTRYSAT